MVAATYLFGDLHAMARLRLRGRPLYVTKVSGPWQGVHGPEFRLAIRCRQAAVRGRCPMGVQIGCHGGL